MKPKPISLTATAEQDHTGPEPQPFTVVGDTPFALSSDVAQGFVAKCSPDEASIRAAVTAVQAAGGGTVLIPPRTVGGAWEPITLTSPLPIVEGVKYEGVEPVTEPINPATGAYLGDMEWDYVGGTVFIGDGTFAAFQANSTDLGSAPASIGDTAIHSAGVINVGVQNFTYGLCVGATNTMGMVWGEVRNFYARDCSVWGVRLVNFQHVDIDNVRTTVCQNGQYYGAALDGSVMMPGNSSICNLFNMPPRDSRDLRLCRGIVFEADGNAGMLNQLDVSRIQCNAFNRVKLSVTATFTNGSTSVAVPDGTKFAVGMPVIFTSTAAGVTANLCYVVASVSGNNITLANDRVSAAISATASTTATLESYGFPNVEFSRRTSTARVQNSRFMHIDVEGSATAAVYIDGASYNYIQVSELPQNLHSAFVGRSSVRNQIESWHSGTTDFDSGSTSSRYYGARKTMLQRALAGLWIDEASTGYNALAIGGGQANVSGGDIQSRSGGYLYPNAGMGTRMQARDTAITFGGLNVGGWVFTGGSGVTWTLPAISDSNIATSLIGAVFEIYNVGSNSLTITTQSSQTFNNVAAKTSITLAAGAAVRLVAAKTNGGTMFWVAHTMPFVA